MAVASIGACFVDCIFQQFRESGVERYGHRRSRYSRDRLRIRGPKTIGTLSIRVQHRQGQAYRN